MKVGICDDDKRDLEITYKICKKTFEQLEVDCEILTFASGEAVLKCDSDMHLLILDIEMNGISGIDLKHILQEYNSETTIIFVTDHDEFVLSAFGMRVFGFVMKKNITIQLPKLINDFVVMESSVIIIDEDIDSRNIIYIKAARIYTEVYLKGMDAKLTRRSVREYESLLKTCDFIRIHKSYLINFAYVDKMTDDKVYMGRAILPIATRLRKEVQNEYRAFCRKKARYC